MLRFIIYIVISYLTINCNEENLHSKTICRTENTKYLLKIDTNEIMSNIFLERNYEAIKKSIFFSVTNIDSLPNLILKQLSLISLDSFKVIKNEKKLELDKLKNQGTRIIPCRKINYIGMSDNFTIIAYLQACSDYTNNILIIKHSSNEIQSLWIGNLYPSIINTEKLTYKNIKLTSPEIIFDYLDYSLNRGELHVSSKLVI